MVTHPTAYSLAFEDVDYSTWKAAKKRTKQKNSPDIEFAIQAAKKLVSKTPLPQHVQHYPSKHPELPDFIFEGAGFHDPGDIVQWRNIIPNLEIPQVLNQ
jgi:hypothetical protein